MFEGLQRTYSRHQGQLLTGGSPSVHTIIGKPTFQEWDSLAQDTTTRQSLEVRGVLDRCPDILGVTGCRSQGHRWIRETSQGTEGHPPPVRHSPAWGSLRCERSPGQEPTAANVPQKPLAEKVHAPAQSQPAVLPSSSSSRSGSPIFASSLSKTQREADH